MGKRYRVKRKESVRPARGIWIILTLLGFFSVCAIGVSTTASPGESWALKFALRFAMFVSSVAGRLSVFLYFLLVFTSLFKLFRPSQKLPLFVRGLWVTCIFALGIYHDLAVPWKDTFAAAKMGGGGGLLGASIDWFFRSVLGRIPALAIESLGFVIGTCLLFNKPATAPFTAAWLGWTQLSSRIRDLLAYVFREQGPDESEIELEALEEFGGTSQAEDSHEVPATQSEPASNPAADELAGTVTPERVETRASRARSSFAAEVERLRARIESGDQRNGAKANPDSPEIPVRTTAAKLEPQDLEQPSLSDEIFYEFPPLDILDKQEASRRSKSTEILEERAKIIEKTLASFGVAGRVVNITQGPAVTSFELQPGPGVKVSTILNLAQDLALALAAQDVRIEAPIPGKAVVGIEVPNKEKSLVHLRDVLESRDFKNSPSPLTVALGKDISGKPVVAKLDKCVHLLIAGATGAGKSVCINSMIASLLYKARPDQVKLILIDPKRVELSVWSRIPHLISPVVSDPRKAAGVLRWAIKDMEARYEKFTKVGTRDIDRYNEVATPPGSLKPAMPYIVIIIDELSDLMMVAPAEVEDAIFRLAQMARASGIFLVVATQRPSVDVLTGTIKANIPSRIAFAVSSQIDSRTILDMAGAEKLLGRGDMLFFPVGASKPLRAQGCYISEREIDELVSFVSSRAKPQFAPGILSEPETCAQETEMSEDPLFAQALRIVVEAKQASVSLLQRKLPIGYSRAARLIDAMETRGYVGPYEGSKPREVKLTMQQYIKLFESPAEKEPQRKESPSQESTVPRTEWRNRNDPR